MKLFAEDIEQAVLGAMMLEKTAPSMVIHELKKETFYIPKHQDIFEAIECLFNTGSPVDIMTVTAQLRKTGNLDSVGGAYEVSQLTSRVSSAANIEYHAKILAEKHVERKLLDFGSWVLNEVKKEADGFEKAETITNKLLSILDDTISKRSFLNFQQQLLNTQKNIEAAIAKHGSNEIVGLETGVRELDLLTGGLQKGNIYLIGARPSMGKTAFVINMLVHNANKGLKGLFFSLEMPYKQITKRILSNISEVWGTDLNTGDLDDAKIKRIDSAIKQAFEYNITIDDTPAINITHLRSVALKTKLTTGLDFIIIDYLQLMSGLKGGGNREQEISKISMSLKSLAKELDVPIIPLAQLSREVEKRADKRPILSDLRESGSLEQDADFVMFLYRPSYYYKKLQNDVDYRDNIFNEQDYLEVLELIVAKNREGGINDLTVEFKLPYSKVKDRVDNNTKLLDSPF